MAILAKDQRVSDLTVGQFKSLIRETFFELIDPDYGLELKPEVEEALRNSHESKTRIPVEEVAKELGLEW